MEKQDLKFTNSVLFVPFFAALVIWFVYWIEIKFNINLNDFGVYPRKPLGLRGILFSPFIHGSTKHLFNNTLPLMVLLAATFYFYREVAWRVLIFGVLLSGLLTWIIGRPSYHIGASGLIYVLVSFIFFKGIIIRHYRLIALSLAVVFLYGSMIWYIFPIKDGISWEGHLAGFAVGLLFALVLKDPKVVEEKYPWQKEGYNEKEDEFMRHFDEDGNFIEQNDSTEEVKFKYEYKPNDSKSD